MVRLSFIGGQDLAARLNALPAALAADILRDGLREAAAPMRDRMADRAPRGADELGRPDRAPGHLADHIVISSTRTVDGERLNEHQAAVAVGPAGAYWWGGFSEFGTFREPARAFARPAFDATAAEALGLLSDVLWARLREAAARGLGASFAPTDVGTIGASEL